MEQVNPNNIEYLDIKQSYGLSDEKIAELLDMSTTYLRTFTCDPEKKTHKLVSNKLLRLFKLVLKAERIKPINQT